MVLVLWDYWKSHIYAEMQNLLATSVATDIAFQVGSKRLELHSFILVMFSRFLKDVISSLTQEESSEMPLVFSFPDFTYETVELVINFMYSGEITIPDEYLNEVIELSNFLGIKGLEDLAPFMINQPNTLELEINAEDVPMDSHSFNDILKHKKIKAEIIPVVKQKETPKKIKSDISFLKCKRVNVNRKRDRKRKFQRQFPEGPNCLDVSAIRDNFLSVSEKYVKCTVDLPAIGNWPLSSFGIVLQKSRDDPFTPPSGVKCSRRNINRFRREMSYLWHGLMSKFTEEQRIALIREIPDGNFQLLYNQLLKGTTLVELMENNTISSDELKTILMILLVSGDINLDLAVEAYSGIEFQPLYMDRIEEAIELYRSTDTFLTDIAKKQWISDLDLSSEIEKRGVQRNERYRNFDTFLHRAIECSSDGFNKEYLQTVAPESHEFVEDIERIFEYHKNAILLPMACYEMRMDNAVFGVKFGGSSDVEASSKFMVPLQHLKQRTSDSTVEDTRCFEYSTGKPRRIGRKSKITVSLQEAIEFVRNGGDLQEAFVTYDIRNPKIRKIIEYNIKRTNPPLNEPYDSRFQKAVQMVERNGSNIFEAACHFVVNYRTLHARLTKMKISSPVVVKNEISPRCGLWSSRESDLKNAIVSANNGAPLAEVFKKFKLKTKRQQKIVEYNVGREDAPLDVPFRMRLMKAVEMVQTEKAFLTEAACHHIVNFSSLWRYLTKIGWIPSMQRTEFSAKRKRLVGFWSRVDLKLRKAIEDARSGTPLEEVYRKHSVKCLKSRQIVKYNKSVPNPPLDKPYRERFKEAISSIDSYEMDMISAACSYIVPYPVLYKFFYKKEKLIGPEFDATLPKIKLMDCKSSFTTENDSMEVENSPRLDGGEFSQSSLQFVDTSTEGNQLDSSPDVKEGLRGTRMLDAVIAVRKGESVLKACETHMVNTKEIRFIVNYNKDRSSPPLHVPFNKRFQNAVSLVKDKGLTVLLAACQSIVNPDVLRHYLSRHLSESERLSLSVKSQSPSGRQFWSDHEKRLRNAISDANNGKDLKEVFKTYNLNLRNQKVVRYNINRPDAPLDEPFEDRLEKALKMVEGGLKATEAAKKCIVNPGAIYNYFSSCKTPSKRKFKAKILKGKSMKIEVTPEKDLTKESRDSESKMSLRPKRTLKKTLKGEASVRPKRTLKKTLKGEALDVDMMDSDDDKDYNPSHDS